MNRGLGAAVAVVSGSGFPLTQLAIARLGRPGAAITIVVTAGLLAAAIARIVTRDTAAEGRGTSALLYAEAGVAALATAANLALVTEQGLDAARTRGWHVGPAELIRRISLGTLFGLLAARYRVYLGVPASPGR